MTAVPIGRSTGSALHKPLRFVLAGGVAAIANFFARIVLGLFLPYSAAIVIAFLVGMLTAFLLNRRFVFPEATQGLRHQAFWFVAINLLALLQTLAVSLLLAELVLPWLGMRWHPETLAHAVGIIVPIFTSYLGHQRLTFR